MINKSRKEIPKSIIRGNVVNTDLEARNKGEKILFLNPACVIIGAENLPETIFVTPEFENQAVARLY